ncbi:MAG: hypothetical protein ABI837_16615, partial [Acidobacteriota bacterium]
PVSVLAVPEATNDYGYLIRTLANDSWSYGGPHDLRLINSQGRAVTAATPANLVSTVAAAGHDYGLVVSNADHQLDAVASLSGSSGDLELGQRIDLERSYYQMDAEVLSDGTGYVVVYQSFDLSYSQVRAVRFTPGGTILWNVELYKEARNWANGLWARSVAMSRNRLVIAYRLDAGETFVKMFDPATGRTIATTPLPSQSVTISPLTAFKPIFRVGSDGRNLVMVWQTKERELRATRLDDAGNAIDGEGIVVARLSSLTTSLRVTGFTVNTVLVSWRDYDDWLTRASRVDLANGAAGPAFLLNSRDNWYFGLIPRAGGGGAVVISYRKTLVDGTLIEVPTMQDLIAAPTTPRRRSAGGEAPLQHDIAP